VVEGETRVYVVRACGGFGSVAEEVFVSSDVAPCLDGGHLFVGGAVFAPGAWSSCVEQPEPLVSGSGASVAS
jgi:hypothetical protein